MKRTYLLLLLLFMYWMYASAQQVQTAQEPADSVKNVAYIDSLYRELPEVMITGERPVVKSRTGETGIRRSETGQQPAGRQCL